MFITEDKLLIISIILSIAGIILLYVIRETISTPISYDTFLEEGEVFVVLKGEADNIQQYEWGSRFLLETQCNIPVIISEQVQAGNVTIYGSKSFYQGRPEVSAQRIVYE